MSKKKPELRSYLVTMRETVRREYVVDALDEAQAEAFVHERGELAGELEMVDWVCERVEINE